MRRRSPEELADALTRLADVVALRIVSQGLPPLVPTRNLCSRRECRFPSTPRRSRARHGTMLVCAPYAPAAIELIVEAYGLSERVRALDLGCGPGTIAIPLS